VFENFWSISSRSGIASALDNAVKTKTWNISGEPEMFQGI